MGDQCADLPRAEKTLIVQLRLFIIKSFSHDVGLNYVETSGHKIGTEIGICFLLVDEMSYFLNIWQCDKLTMSGFDLNMFYHVASLYQKTFQLNEMKRLGMLLYLIKL
jgi:hypothetical protein